MLSIREYVHQLDWDNICKIHDKARILELEESAPKEAFIPLRDCYKVEKLFDSTIFVAEQNNETIGFVAFCNQEITWLYVDPKFAATLVPNLSCLLPAIVPLKLIRSDSAWA